MKVVKNVNSKHFHSSFSNDKTKLISIQKISYNDSIIIESTSIGPTGGPFI